MRPTAQDKRVPKPVTEQRERDCQRGTASGVMCARAVREGCAQAGVVALTWHVIRLDEQLAAVCTIVRAACHEHAVWCRRSAWHCSADGCAGQR